MKIDNFFAELKRRNVYKVAIAYIFAGWALSQGIAQVFPVFDVPNWVIRSIVVMIILGLPVALVLAWMFELTPEGIKRTETADAMPAGDAKEEIRLDLCRRDRRRNFDRIIFSRSLQRGKHDSFACWNYEQIDRRSAVRQSQPRSGQRLLLRRRAG